MALTLDKLHDSSQPNSNPDLAIQAAAAAGLADREAEWRKQSLLTGDVNHSTVDAYAILQQSRLQFSELAHTLEAYAARLSPRRQDPILTQAAKAFRDAGDTPDEVRLARALVLRNNSPIQERFFDLLLRRDPTALTALASNSNAKLADAALNYTVAHGPEAQALAAVANRGQLLNPVWRPASASLVQSYFAGPASNPVNVADFNQSLAANSTIADRLATAADPSRQLTGDAFFYYASRYGIFLATVHDSTQSLPDAEDFLPGELERAPTSPTAYLNLARTYSEAHNVSASVAE